VVASSVKADPSWIPHSFVFEEVLKLSQRGLEIHVARFLFHGEEQIGTLYFHDTYKKVDPKVLLDFIKKMRYYSFGSLLRNPKGLYSELLYSKLIYKLIHKIRPTLIHAHFAYPEAWSALLARRHLKIPLVVTLHGYDINILHEYNYGIRRLRAYDHIVRKVLRHADCVIGVSQDLARMAKELGARNVVYLPNGVDTKVFTPELTSGEAELVNNLRRRWNIEDADVVVGFFRHLRPYYGIHYLIPVIRYVVSKTRTKVKFIWAGDGVEPYKTLILNMLKKAGIDQYVSYIGALPRTLMPIVYKTVNIVTNTSLTDGMPPSVLEAMATGRPVISFAVGGNKDIISHGIDGFLVQPGDYKTYSKLLLFLIENPDEVKKLGYNARRKIINFFDSEKRIENLIKIYKVIAKNEK